MNNIHNFSDNDNNLRQWLPVICLSLAAFVFNTTEFVPIALLSDIAKDLQITEPQAGTLITVYAWYVAIFSLPLMMLCAKVERRKLIFALFVIFIVSHLLSGMAASYNMLLASRLGIATAHSVFWSITVPLAVRLAPTGGSAKALGLIATGSSLAMVLGLPIGRTIGLWFGWRITFVVIALIALVALGLLMKVLPVTQSRETGSFKSVALIFKNKKLRYVYYLTVVIVTANFLCYTYIEPYLMTVRGFSENLATVALLVYGAFGILASVLYAKANENGFLRNVFAPISGICVSLLILNFAPFHYYPLVVMSVWGMMVMLLGLNMHERVIRFAKEGTDIAMSLYSGIFNIGIGLGALLGGLVITNWSLAAICSAGVVIAIPTLYFCYHIQKPE